MAGARRHGVTRRLLGIAILGLLLAVFLAAPSWGHGKKYPAKTLVKQAIALLRTQPEQVEAIEDKIHDALEAKNTKGVDLTLVREADEAFEAGRIHRTWDLLEVAIGAAPHRVVATPNPAPGLPAPVEQVEEPQTAPVLHERAIEGSEGAPGGAARWVLLGIAGTLLGLGLLIAGRVR